MSLPRIYYTVCCLVLPIANVLTIWEKKILPMEYGAGLGLSDRLVKVVCTPMFTAPFCLLIGSDDFSSFFFLERQ